MSEELADRNYWARFWGQIRLPQRIDRAFKNDRIITNTILAHVPRANFDRWAVEIGCAPGRWLVFLNREMGYCVSGYEYLEAAAEKTRENLALCGVPAAQSKVITADFLRCEAEPQYDLVVSLGFIEHFANSEEIMTKHLDLLKPCGYLVFGIPNFSGLNRWIQWITDRYLADKVLSHHNLDVMNVAVFHEFGRRHDLEELYCGYTGGFERGLFRAREITHPLIRIFTSLVIHASSRLLGRINSRLISGYILAVFRQKSPGPRSPSFG